MALPAFFVLRSIGTKLALFKHATQAVRPSGARAMF